ncbi:MAG TPA: tRNA preQ1(34) S-adenosylmethionine ribosyltransferase-isomerase QueA [Steroidobacteraceae bacterium]|jgi:S-adenosylmethionine:tRNA ribosyltransferase-isomerase|nr:tRNA preQ1(34) S-adenosylmethionine ribosyltransferase-isomerase QueA [Steroidobacteraceae bacterium]
MQRKDFHFELPQELIAQRPAPTRSGSRLLALEGDSGAWRDMKFGDLPELLRANDLLVFNDTRVVPARVHGTKESGGKIELLLERVLTERTALVHARSSKALKEGATVSLPGARTARLLDRQGDLFRLEFSCGVLEFFEAFGEVPLPPYIGRAPEEPDRERYQTVYAREPGAVAAPTAGLHFDAAMFAALEARGVDRTFVTLHVGAGTFQPVRAEAIEHHEMHTEYLDVGAGASAAIAAARSAGGRVVAVGTTVVRSLETAAAAQAGAAAARGVQPYRGSTQIFIRPGFKFRVVDAMITNFHLPESTLLMLCSAFVGRERLLAAYAHAVEARYRFFSYGDAMFLTPASGSLA